MQNIELQVEGDRLTIVIDLSKSLGPSKSGKTEVIASTRGNVSVTDDGAVKLGLNVYKYTTPKG